MTALQWLGVVCFAGYALYALVLAISAVTARRFLPHRVEHWLKVNRGKVTRRVLENGCEWVCSECEDCGAVRKIGHSVYCDGCGRRPR